MIHLSPNFTLSEATKSDTAIRLGIDNTPPESLLPSMRGVAQAILQPVREHFAVAFSPTSWFRCEALERAICWGADNVNSSFAKWCRRRGLAVNEESWAEYFKKKQHPRGESVDFEVPGVTNFTLATWIMQNIPEFDQLILEFYDPADPHSGWVHCSHKLTGINRKEVLRIGKYGARSGLID